MKFPIYIPSKSRASTCSTAKLLEDCRLKFLIAVEPSEVGEYSSIYGRDRILDIKENSRGLAYSRNFCMRHAESLGFSYCWQLDDDLTAFYLRRNGKNEKCKASEAMQYIEQAIFQYANIAAAGLKHCVFAWSEKRPISINRQVYTAQIIRTNTGKYFRPGTISDADFNMQILAAGWCTVLFNRVIFSTSTTIGHDLSEEGVDEKFSSLKKTWPGVFKIRNTPSGPRIAPSNVWSKFPQRPIRRA